MTIEQNYNDIKTKIKENCKLIAVSKRQSDERIDQLLSLGHRIYGENQLQEAQTRWNTRKINHPDIELHFIGSIQSNKVAEIVTLCDAIHTIDREKTAKAVSRETNAQNKKIKCFIQINTGEEEQKSGILPKDLPSFHNFCVNECALDVIGLMCLPPINQPAALHFAFLKKLAEENNLEELSMGMSGDYEKALDLGATYIRVGSGLFGER